MKKVHIPSYEALRVWFWIMLNGETYNQYVTQNQWVTSMEIEDKEIFYLLVWYSEGCPDIG